jgi:putative transposase
METLQPSTYFHVYNHANGDEDLFRNPENHRYFLQQYHKHIDIIADTYSFCLMPNPRLTGRAGFSFIGEDQIC